MKIRKIAVCICAFTLVASLVSVNVLPVFAAGVSEASENNDGLIYVDDSLYNGYYMDNVNNMYIVKNGASTLKTGNLKAGTTYYSYNAKAVQTLAKSTLYVDGKAYTGYYLDSANKMYHVNNGIRVFRDGTKRLKTGMLKAGTQYYSYAEKKTKKLTKNTLYVKGKVYTGYYLDNRNKMYRVKNGTRTLASTIRNEGTSYYSYNAKQKLKLTKQTVYVKGKAYTGYYLDSRNKMYKVKNGTHTLVNTGLKAGTKYYSYKANKTLKLSKKTVYVNGKEIKGMSAKSLTTLQRAQKIVNKITDSSMTKEEKLKVCFDYMKVYEEKRPRTPHYIGMDWPVVYANDMFLKGAGNCFSYAAAFAYMAKAIGYEEVYCCNSGGHGWTEIDGLIYDTQWSQEHHVYNYYGLSYDTKTDVAYKESIKARKPWMHIKI